MICTHAADGAVQCELKVTEQLANSYGTLHGGAISTIVDVLGTMALLTRDHTRAGVSVEVRRARPVWVFNWLIWVLVLYGMPACPITTHCVLNSSPDEPDLRWRSTPGRRACVARCAVHVTASARRFNGKFIYFFVYM